MLRPFHRQVELENWASEHVLLPQAAQPDDWPAEYGFAIRSLSPLRHGHYLSGLSAAFAAANGIRLLASAEGPLTSAEEQALLGAAWRWARGRQCMQPDRGLRQNDWIRLVECLCQWFGRRHGCFIAVWQPWWDCRPGRDEFLIAIERLIVSRHVLLGLFVGARYSVIRGYTRTSLLLFDSGGQRWIKRSSLGLVGTESFARHRIAATPTLALRRR